MLDVGVSKQLIACYYRYQDKLFTKVNSLLPRIPLFAFNPFRRTGKV